MLVPPPLQALPLVNSGSYGICLLNFLMGIAGCAIAFGPKEIVALMGVSLQWTKYLTGLSLLALGLWQIVGVLGIATERYSVYRFYIFVHRLGLLAVFIPPIVFIIVAGVQHNKTYDSCIANFGYNPPVSAAGHVNSFDSSTYRDVGHDICNALIYAQLGCMAGLLVLLAVLEVRAIPPLSPAPSRSPRSRGAARADLAPHQAYFVTLQTSYGHQMRDALHDHKK